MKKLVSSAAEKGHFRLGRHIPRNGVVLDLTSEELEVLDSDPRVKISEPKAEKTETKSEAKK
jgi:hypothetical protein